mmetsp:Transcript_8230/g.10129  ORF Transcript_8230/g.10129 Transcript_8230/m.10129 type:complete len:596 (+) Transcript_8230:62-1849(+)
MFFHLRHCNKTRNATTSASPFLLITPLLVLLLSSSPLSTLGYDGKLTVIPNSDEAVTLVEKYRLPFSTLSYPADPTLRIVSDIPVTVHRFTDGNFYAGNNVVEDVHLWVFVKTNCPERYASVNAIAKKDVNEELTSLEIKANVAGEVEHIPASNTSIVADWYYDYYWCQVTGGFNRGLRMRGSIFDNNGPSEDGVGGEEVVEGQDDGGCGVVAELVYDGCRRPVDVLSPAGLRVTTVNLRDIKRFNTTKECTKRFEANVKPVKTFVRNGADTVSVRQLTGSQCGRTIEGRPFIDDTGELLHSEASVGEDACWAGDNSNLNPNSNPINKDDKLASSWVTRSLGEHSSIASFAALTISLLTNNAPPQLIKDTLLAALDEVNHATTSFQIASQLSNTAIGPKPLPASSHQFQYDKQDLVKKTFHEGCVDETLSAVVAALEAENERDDVLKRELARIASDEARHAALAFRTVHWGCKGQEAFCRDNFANYFSDETVLMDLIETRLAGFAGDTTDDVQSLVEYLYSALLEFVTRVDDHDQSMKMPCERHVSTFSAMANKGVGIVQNIINEIVTQVLCDYEHDQGDSSGAEEVDMTTLEQE